MSTFNVNDSLLLAQTALAVRQTSQLLLDRFDPNARPTCLLDLLAMIDANDQAASSYLRECLASIYPKARWLEDEETDGPLPAGEWWVVDPVEGNVNHIHGLTDWGVTATLVRDNQAVLTVIDEALTAKQYTAQYGGGAYLNGNRLQTSKKHELQAALVCTGQAAPGEDLATLERIARSSSAMLKRALLVKVAVPAAMQLAHVAAGRLDAFWQASNVLSGLAGGTLLVRESGGMVTDWDGEPWTFASRTCVASAPLLHDAMVQVLSQYCSLSTVRPE